MNVLITLNAYKYNRGSEALVSGLATICKKYDKDCFVTVSSGTEGERLKIIPKVDKIVSRKRNIDSLDKYDVFAPLIDVAKESDIVFIVGADNYDPSYGIQNMMYDINTCILSVAKGKVIMYDCSLDPQDLTDGIIDDLKRFTYITARETITYNAMLSKLNNVELFPDPAFVMEKKEIELPEIFNMNVDVVGINLSNLILNGYGTNKQVLINAYIALIDNILLKSDSNVILLPHVMGGADLSALRIIQKKFLNNERVVLYDNEEISACELKFIISKCGYLVTARTHAAIAGYSSCVPTLAIGYSVKSFGIAKDIFGRSDNYVIHTKDVIHENDLVRRFEWIKSNEINIRDCLKKKMKGYIEKAENTIAALCKKR